MKSPKELFEGLPKHDKVTIKVKGYRPFVADEVKLRWIAWQVADGKINPEDVTIIENNGLTLGIQPNGRLTRKLSTNIYELAGSLDMKVIRKEFETRKKLETC